jgi:hypothetical protein
MEAEGVDNSRGSRPARDVEKVPTGWVVGTEPVLTRTNVKFDAVVHESRGTARYSL